MGQDSDKKGTMELIETRLDWLEDDVKRVRQLFTRLQCQETNPRIKSDEGCPDISCYICHGKDLSGTSLACPNCGNNKEVKPIILDDNPVSLACYAQEYPENWKAMTDAKSTKNAPDDCCPKCKREYPDINPTCEFCDNDSNKSEQWWLEGRPAQSKFTPEEIKKRIDETKGKVCKCGHRVKEHRQPHHYKLEMVCEAGGLGEQCNCKMFSTKEILNSQENKTTTSNKTAVDFSSRANTIAKAGFEGSTNTPDIHSQLKDEMQKDYPDSAEVMERQPQEIDDLMETDNDEERFR